MNSKQETAIPRELPPNLPKTINIGGHATPLANILKLSNANNRKARRWAKSHPIIPHKCNEPVVAANLPKEDVPLHCDECRKKNIAFDCEKCPKWKPLTFEELKDKEELCHYCYGGEPVMCDGVCCKEAYQAYLDDYGPAEEDE
jgi:hypothetical protein